MKGVTYDINMYVFSYNMLFIEFLLYDINMYILSL